MEQLIYFNGKFVPKQEAKPQFTTTDSYTAMAFLKDKSI